MMMKTGTIVLAICLGISKAKTALRSGLRSLENNDLDSTLSGTIPIVVVNDPDDGWSAYTYIQIGGSGDPIPLLVDTGSSLPAICPGNKIGNAVNKNIYACGAYNVGNNGWNGTFYTADVIFGDGQETVTDPSPEFTFALIADQNTEICTPNLQGILGVDLGSNPYYDSPVPMPSNEYPACDGNLTGEDLPAFASTMLQQGDNKTMAFVGLNPSNEGKSFLAFGSAATNALANASLAGSTGIDKAQTSWYVLNSANFVFSVSSNASSTVSYNADLNSAGMGVIVDSGTQGIIFPSSFRDAFNSIPSQSDVTIDIEFDGTKLQIPFSLLESTGAYDFSETPVLGIPSFWVYDIEFNIEQNFIAFYNRM